MRIFGALLGFLLTVCVSSSACAKASDTGANWLTGFWAQVIDEDGKPFDDTIEFRSDGTAVSYLANCDVLAKSLYHVHDGKVYVTARVRKGFVSLLFVPSDDRKQLVFTSVRTANNAIYERSQEGAGCIPARS